MEISAVRSMNELMYCLMCWQHLQFPENGCGLHAKPLGVIKHNCAVSWRKTYVYRQLNGRCAASKVCG